MKMNIGTNNPHAEQEIEINQTDIADSILESDLITRLISRRVGEHIVFGEGMTNDEFLKQLDTAIKTSIERAVENADEQKEADMHGDCWEGA